MGNIFHAFYKVDADKSRAAGALPDQPSKIKGIRDEPDLCMPSRDRDDGILKKRVTWKVR